MISLIKPLSSFVPFRQSVVSLTHPRASSQKKAGAGAGAAMLNCRLPLTAYLYKHITSWLHNDVHPSRRRLRCWLERRGGGRDCICICICTTMAVQRIIENGTDGAIYPHRTLAFHPHLQSMTNPSHHPKSIQDQQARDFLHSIIAHDINNKLRRDAFDISRLAEPV